MDLEYELRRLGGVARTSRLLELGTTRHHLSVGLRNNRLIRPTRGWLALPDADIDLVNAARNGVVISCITQAERLGLWVLEHPQLHVAAPPGRHVHLQNVRVHRRLPLKPREPGLLADHLENVLDCVAACQPRDAALAIWDSALQKGLTDLAALSEVPFRGRAKALLAEASPFSDSGLETFVRIRLQWLQLRILTQIWLYGHRLDFLIGERLVLQTDGGTHTGKQRTSDIRHDAELKKHGYHVLRFSYAQVVDCWPEVQAAVLDAIARGLHLAQKRSR